MTMVTPWLMTATAWFVCGSCCHWACMGTSPRAKTRIRRVPCGMGGVPGGNGPAAGDGWPGGGSSLAGATYWAWSTRVCRRASANSGLRCVHAALIDARQHVGLARHHAGADLHVADRVEAAEPFLVVDFHRLAIADQADADIAFEIGDHLRALVRAGRGMVDPEHRFLADRRVVALHQPAVAPQQPHFVRRLVAIDWPPGPR